MKMKNVAFAISWKKFIVCILQIKFIYFFQLTFYFKQQKCFLMFLVSDSVVVLVNYNNADVDLFSFSNPCWKVSAKN